MRGPTTGDFKKRMSIAKAPPGVPVHGVVHSIEHSASHPGTAKLTIMHGQPGKIGKGSGLGFDDRPESTAHIHIEDANRLKIGQKIHLRPHDGEYGGGTSDEYTE